MSFLDKPRPTPAGSREIRYCKRCLMPDSRPRIVFNAEGVCNACLHAESKQTQIDWEARQKEFRAILDQHRSDGRAWDCVVPWSGGKDSSSIAYKLKYDYGMNPLLVTFSPILPNEVGNENREALLRAGFDHFFIRPNQKVHRSLARRFFIERGNPKVAWDAGVNVAPVSVALQYGIKLIFYAEHGETEYGGKVLHEDSGKRRDFTEVIEHQIGDDPMNWVSDEVSEKDLVPYVYPPAQALAQAGITAYYFSYFNKWSMFENYQYIKERIPFGTARGGRTSGTFTDFDSLDDKFDPLYYYMQYIKFGFGRCVRDASRFIQNNHMTREEGLEACRKYDHEFPLQDLDQVLEYLGMSMEEFTQTVDKHRNSEIWERHDGGWRLRFPLPEK